MPHKLKFPVFVVRRDDDRYAYFDVSDVQPVIRWTNAPILAYRFGSREDAQQAIKLYLGGVGAGFGVVVVGY